jgi:hypothetical protein
LFLRRVSEITSAASDENDDHMGGRQILEPPMIKTIASRRSRAAGLVMLNLILLMQGHAPHDDLINRPIFDCNVERSMCADRMSWRAPTSTAPRAATINA